MHDVICKFRFVCDKTWQDLNEIAGRPDVRFCGSCNEPVFLCSSYSEFSEHAAKSHCVALDTPGQIRALVGEPAILVMPTIPTADKVRD